MHVHVLEVGVYVISVPVQWIVLHPQVVSGKVAGWVSQVVILVPKNSFRPRRGRNDFCSYWQPDI